VLACFLLAATFSGTALGQALTEIDGAEYIEQFDVELVIGEKGELDVTETIRYHFGPGEKHGIYRDIPEDYVTSLGTRESFDITVASIHDAAGEDIKYEEDRSGGMFHLKIGDPGNLISGVETYSIRYRVDGAITFFEDFDELYWNATGHDWPVSILRTSVRVRTPEPVTGWRFVCYVGSRDSTGRCDTKPSADGPVTKQIGTVNWYEPLQPGSGVTVALGFDKGYIDEPTLFERALHFFMSNPFIPLPFIVFGMMFHRWRREGRDPKGRGTIISEYDVPAGFTPLHMAALQDGRVTGKAIPAAIIDLAVKGYLRIERIEQDGLIFNSTDYRFIETGARPSSGSIESDLIEALFGTAKKQGLDMRRLLASPVRKFLPGSLWRSIEPKLLLESVKNDGENRTVAVSDLKDKFFAKIPALQKRAIADLIVRKLYEASPQEVWGKYALGGVIILFGAFFLVPLLELQGASIAALFVTILVYSVFVYLMPRVTQQGAIVKEQLLGLKDYLQIALKRRIEFHNAPEKTPELFEKLLPAALLLGVSDIWAKEFADISLSEPEWYRGGNGASFSAVSFTTDLGGFDAAAGASLASAPSGSGSGGGGFSGGGGGGGGGGSW